MAVLRSFSRIVDRHTAVVVLASLAATFLCVRLGFGIELPEGLIGIAVVFPLGFSISAAYARREDTLRSYASVKALAVALYFAHRDWIQAPPDHLARLRALTGEILDRFGRHLRQPRAGDASVREIYLLFSEISPSVDSLRAVGASTKEVARANQFLSLMMSEMEQIRNVRLYRTPQSLRAYSQTFLNVLPVLFAPHFAHLAAQQSPLIGYAMAALYSTILVCLDNIQEALEDPFDQTGEDDIRLDARRHYLAATEGLAPAPVVAVPIAVPASVA